MCGNNELVEISLRCGADRATVIPVEDIPFDPGLRAYCEANVCGCYGKNYACPPGVGPAEEVIAKARRHERALVLQSIGRLEDSFDWEGMRRAAERHAEIAAATAGELRERGLAFLQLGAGGCTVCPVCAQAEGTPCRFPDRAVSSLEAYCVNVSALAAQCGMKYINGENTVTYFSAYLFA